MSGFDVQAQPSRTRTVRHYYARSTGSTAWVRITADQYRRLLAQGARDVTAR